MRTEQEESKYRCVEFFNPARWMREPRSCSKEPAETPAVQKQNQMATAIDISSQIEQRLLARNELNEFFFVRETSRLAVACREMSERFLRGGRLLAFGQGPYVTDAQHVSVEFVHPVIVGKRALPALDLSVLFRPWLDALLQADDIVMGFGPPEGDPEVWAALDSARAKKAMTFALPGSKVPMPPRPPLPILSCIKS